MNMAKQAEKQVQVKYVAYADFEWQNKQYEVGDAFVPPAGLSYDPTFEEFRNLSRQNHSGSFGVPFVYQVQVAVRKNEQTGKNEPVMDARRVILPVEVKGGETA